MLLCFDYLTQVEAHFAKETLPCFGLSNMNFFLVTTAKDSKGEQQNLELYFGKNIFGILENACFAFTSTLAFLRAFDTKMLM